jgi:putative aminopeptidase FrvX
VRLGDRIAAFDPALQQRMLEAAGELAGRRRGFRVQRCLMDGGTCEASAFAAHGYRTGGLALPLANYHNMGRRGIAAERIDLGDLRGALDLLYALATRRERPARAGRVCDPARLLAALRAHEARLRASVPAPAVPWPEARRS